MSASASPMTVARHQAVRACLWQLALTLVLAIAVLFAAGGRSGLAVLAGGGIATLGTAYLVLAMYRQRPGVPAGRVVWDVFLSWAVKLVLIVSLLTIAFRTGQLPPSFLMAGLGGALLAYWLAMSTAGTGRGSERDGG